MIKYKNIYYSLILIAASLFFPLFYGHKGILPIDSFLIFNGGYNIFNGYYPFKDYWSITGPLLDYIQYFFFIIGKLNWISYVTHAAVFNLILCLFSFYFFLKIELKKEYSFLYALGISILGYTQTGTPFMDHHAFIFSYLSIGFLLLGIKFKKNQYWFFSSFLLIFSFFSKQIPSSYLAIFLFFFSFVYLFFYKKKFANILSLYIGGIFSLFIFATIFVLNKIPFGNFFTQYILYPLTIGDDRFERLSLSINNTVLQFKFLYLAIIPYLVIFFLFIRSKISKEKKNEEILVFIVILSMFLIFGYSQLMTQNQILIFFTIPFFLAISHLYNDKFYKNKIIFVFIISVFLISTVKFHFRFNEGKKFMELAGVNFDLAVDASQLDKRLSNLKWITKEFEKNPQEEINLLIDIKNVLFNEKEKFILMTDYQILSALVNNKNISPNKFYDARSVPQKGNRYLDNYISFAKKKLKDHHIKKIYLISKDKKYIKDLYPFQNCIEYKKINSISLEASIEKCNN